VVCLSGKRRSKSRLSVHFIALNVHNMNSKSDIGFAVRCRVGIAHRAFRDPNNCGQRLFFIFSFIHLLCVVIWCKWSVFSVSRITEQWIEGFLYDVLCHPLESLALCFMDLIFWNFLFFFEWVPWERGSKKKWIWNFCRCVWLCVFCEGRNSRCWMETCFVIENANFDFYHVFWYLVCYNVFYMNFTIGYTPSSLYIYWARKCGDNIYDDMSIYLFVRYRVRIYSMI